MELSINDTRKVIQFAVIISNLKNILDDINFHFREEGLYFQGMDAGHMSLTELYLSKEWFNTYKVDKSYCLGIHIPCLDTIISCLNKGYTIQMQYKKNDRLNIILTDDKIVKEYSMILLEIDEMTMEVPSPEYTSDIIMKSRAFKNYITELTKFGENLRVNSNQKNIVLSTKGDYGKSKIIIDEKYLEEYAIEEDAILEQNYNMAMVKLFTNFTNLNGIVKIHLLENMPMKMQFSLNDEDSENNKITFYLGPKIED